MKAFRLVAVIVILGAMCASISSGNALLAAGFGVLFGTALERLFARLTLALFGENGQ